MTNKPLVSIITPSYNSEEFIEATLNSVLKQVYNNWEMFVVDDNSKDNSVHLITSYAEKDNRIKIIQLLENKGAAHARNIGIENAKGRFIAFLDSDDLWLPNKLKHQIAFMMQNNYSLTYTSYQVIKEDNTITDKIVNIQPRLNYSQMLYSNKMGCLTVMYDTKSLGKVYMPNLRKRQDYALWLKILKKINYAYGLNEVLAHYRNRNNSMSNNKIEMLKWNWILYKKNEKLTYFRAIFYVFSNVYNKLFK